MVSIKTMADWMAKTGGVCGQSRSAAVLKTTLARDIKTRNELAQKWLSF